MPSAEGVISLDSKSIALRGSPDRRIPAGRDASDPRPSRLVVVEQWASSVAEHLLEMSRPDSAFLVDRIPWTESWNSLFDGAPDLLVPVVSARPEEGARLIDWVERHREDAPVLAVFPSEVDEALLAMAARAVDDFVLWPGRTEELRHRIVRMVGPRQQLEAVKGRLIAELGLTNLVGADPAFHRVIETIPRLAASDATVVITGETGTGKELCARAIHHLGRRRSFPFIPVDCGAFPEQLLENELFGHSRGAFTDAHGDQRGLAVLAEGGTLFLDEIDSLSLPAQAKLLRFLEERAFKPLGAERFTRADVRVLAATNSDLQACVSAGRFRSDLFFRLNVFRVRMPPLRERPGDIALLAQHFLDSLTRNGDRPRLTWSPAALRVLERHAWPGNVRELHNVVQRAVTFARGAHILPSDVSLSESASPPSVPEAETSFRHARAQAIDDFEKAYVEELLFKYHGNITRAAREARKDRRAFGRLVKKHGVAPGR